jgi:hypothetical protein
VSCPWEERGGERIRSKLLWGHERGKKLKTRDTRSNRVYHCWHEFYILSIGTNPIGITSLCVHVGFGV